MTFLYRKKQKQKWNLKRLCANEDEIWWL